MRDPVQTMQRPATVIVIDDESHVRTRVVDLLKRFSSVELIGECGDGAQAVEMISSLRPELAFLDIQMPILDGFDVLHALDPADIPVVVFVTAYDQHAIKAFEVNAVDYVLKPIDESRFGLAVSRSLKRVHDNRLIRRSESETNSSLSEQLHRPVQRILVKKRDTHLVIKAQDIEWIEAADKYVRLHTQAETFTCRRSMRELEGKLDSDEFIRIHRSVIVNINAIKEVQPHFHGEYRIIINDGTSLPLGRSYKQSFNARFRSGL